MPSIRTPHPPTDLLDRYAQNRVSAAERTQLEEHPLICDHCRHEVELADQIRLTMAHLKAQEN